MPTREIIRKELFSRVLIEPASRGASELFVLSGYSSASMVTQHFDQLAKLLGVQISLDLIVGMTGRDGIDRTNLLGFQAIPRQAAGNNFNCAFTTRGNSDHSKLFVWCNENGPVEAFLGSSNYTQFGFGLTRTSSVHFETCVAVDPDAAFEIFLAASKGTIGYLNPEIPKHIELFDETAHYLCNPLPEEGMDHQGSVLLPLIQTKGEMAGQPHQRSGLNWGQRPGREPNQAYIPIPSTVRATGFFPKRGTHFQVVTDDGVVFIMTVAQDGDKALETPFDNSLLGKYFRKRLGLVEGVAVEKRDLDVYGSNAVRLIKTGALQYRLEFTQGLTI